MCWGGGVQGQLKCSQKGLRPHLLFSETLLKSSFEENQAHYVVFLGLGENVDHRSVVACSLLAEMFIRRKANPSFLLRKHLLFQTHTHEECFDGCCSSFLSGMSTGFIDFSTLKLEQSCCYTLQSDQVSQTHHYANRKDKVGVTQWVRKHQIL